MENGSVEDAVGYQVKRVQLAFRRCSDAELRRQGVSMSQYAVLRALADHPEASASEVARLCFVTRQSLQDVLAGLFAAALVEHTPGPSRGRARALRLTELGIARLDSAHAAVLGVEATMTAGFTSAERSRLGAALRRCADNLESS